MDEEIFIEHISFNNPDHLNVLVELINYYKADKMGGGSKIKGVKALHLVDGLNERTRRINTGESTSITFTAETAGTFQYFCSVGSHRNLGMKGNFIVA